jgi:DNA polymerase I-like protein with 3'-5' exonuclease and polymerase domains
VLLDCPNEEVNEVEKILTYEFSSDNIRDMIRTFYNFDMSVPLTIDIKKGSNWLDMT